MTLLIALGNDRYSILVADRRITIGGKVEEDEFNKITILFCDDARLAIAFTGLARVGDFRTNDWIRNELWDIGKETHFYRDIIERLRRGGDFTQQWRSDLIHILALLATARRRTPLTAASIAATIDPLDVPAYPAILSGRPV